MFDPSRIWFIFITNLVHHKLRESFKVLKQLLT